MTHVVQVCLESTMKMCVGDFSNSRVRQWRAGEGGFAGGNAKVFNARGRRRQQYVSGYEWMS